MVKQLNHLYFSKAGISEQFEGHYGPVTAINYNAVPGPVSKYHMQVLNVCKLT